MSNYKPQKKNSSYNKKYSKLNSIYFLLPIMFILSLLPIIVKMYSFPTKMNGYDWFPNLEYSSDLFLYYKQWIFVAVTGIMVLIIGLRALYDKRSVTFPKIFYPLFLYAVLALISTIASKYRYFGFHGFIEQFENVFCIIGYVLVIYYCYLVITSEYELQLLINSFAIGALLVGLLGTFQALGYNYIKNRFFQSIIFQTGTDLSSLEFTFGNNTVYSTLFNPNYVGVFSIIVLPLFIVLLFFSQKLYQYILYCAVILTTTINLFGSGSKSGLICIFVAGIIAMIIFRKRIIKLWYILIPLVTLLVLTFNIINIINNDQYINSIKEALSVTKTEVPDLSSLNTSENGVSLVYKQNLLNISLNSDHDIILSDKDGQVITYFVTEATDNVAFLLSIEDIRFSDISIVNYIGESVIDFCLFFEDGSVYPFSNKVFANTNTNTYTYYNRFEKFSPFVTAESLGFKGYEKFATGRGYIWSRTLPLIKNHIILGVGADSFAFVFPQYDYLYLNYSGDIDSVLTKPHSLYLQISIQSGLISLIAFLAFFVMYLIQSFKLYISCAFTKISQQIGVAVLLCTISFLVSSLSNDSSITFSPCFYAIVGIGLAANKIVKKENDTVSK